MPRLEDTPGLFGEGTGSSTNGMIECELCRTVHNKEQKQKGNNGRPVLFASFGEMQICECCFELVENAVLRLMPKILPWYQRALSQIKDELHARSKLVDRLMESAAVSSMSSRRH